ncbi:MAG: hypothetical protein Q9196_006426 [Gyalolechia fulgens]
MDTRHPRLIVTLEASDPTAERAWNRPENRERCEPAPEPAPNVNSIPSRETTPTEPGKVRSRIHLTFDNKPRNMAKGFVFGSDPQRCDVVLGPWPSFSREHFRITFNARGDAILEDTSRVNTCVKYKDEKASGRNHFTWILFGDYDNIKVTLNKVNRDNKHKHTYQLAFKVKWPRNRQSHLAEYEAYRDAYLEARRNALPALSQLGVESQQTTALLTAQHSPRQQQPIFLPGEEIGRGGFGKVYKAVDVSTGYEYAAKKFSGGNWKKEVEILRSLSHEHIVKYVAFSVEQGPMLVMEYLPLGSLARQISITDEDNLQILCQGLQALDYLHSLSPPLAHRDIKPENILVQSRIPFVIKLVDFGLAKYNTTFDTQCGTNAYAAPEVWAQLDYTTRVDIWSLGVVVLEYGYGLPRPSRKREGRSWCQDIVKAAKNIEEHALIDLISNKMLQMDYRRRQSASQSLAEFYRLGLHIIPPVEIHTGKMTGRGGVTRTGSIMTRPLGNIPSDSLWSLFHEIGNTSEITEVAATKRELREGVRYTPRSLGGCLQEGRQISNPDSKATPTPKKRRRPQTSQSPTADTIRGPSKRPRSLLPNKRLDSLRRSSELPISEAESIPVGPWSQTFRRHPESPRSDSASARNNSNRFKGTGNRDQRIADGPVQADNAHDTDSDSDEASSGGSDTSPEPCSSQRQSQPVPPNRISAHPTSPYQSINNNEPSLLELPDSHPHPAKSPPYEVWDSRLRFSGLTEVKPDLRPPRYSWQTASIYGGVSDLRCPPSPVTENQSG